MLLFDYSLRDSLLWKHLLLPEPNKRPSFFEQLFVRFGGGSNLLRPIAQWRFLNIVLWAAIVLGVVGWALVFWLLNR